MANQTDRTDGKTTQEHFENVLSREPFKGLKAVLDSLSPDPDSRIEAVNGTKSYEELVSRLGYRLTLTKQIHVQDSYSRMGLAGGIKAVLSYHDIPTHSSFPTLVNFDSTVTTTPKSADFFGAMLGALKKQLSAQT